MPRLLLVRLLLGILAILCFARMAWYITGDHSGGGELPFDVKPDSQQHAYVVSAVPGVKLPPPLIEGERVDIGQMPVADRAVIFHPGWIEPGTRFTLVVRRNGQALRVPMVTRASSAPATRLTVLESWSSLILMIFILAMALLTVWRGRDGTAWGLCILSTGVLLINIFQTFQLAPLPGFWLRQGFTALGLLIINPSVYVMAESLTATGLSQLWRRVARRVVASCAVASAVMGIASDIWVTYGGGLPPWPEQLLRTSESLVIVVTVIPFLVLLIGYRRAPHENRLRIRWVAWSAGLLIVASVGQSLSPTLHPILFFVCNNVLTGLGIAGYLYAILRTRVVDVAFVVDRAVLFSVITAILFGVFSLLEEVLNHFAVGEQLGWILQALTALLLATLLSPLHRLLDRGLEHVFFHDLRATVSAIKQLAAESVFFEKEDTLLSRALKQLLLPCAAAAIYERNGAVFERRAGHGEGWPERVDVDDPVFVALRAGRRELDARSLESAVRDGRAFAMRVGQILTGAVICRPREGEQLDRDVRAAICELAHAVSTSLYLLRYREQARLIAEIAAGQVDHAAARSRAAALMVAV